MCDVISSSHSPILSLLDENYILREASRVTEHPGFRV